MSHVGPVRLLNSTTAGHTPSLPLSGQLAINEADEKLFYRGADGTVYPVDLAGARAMDARVLDDAASGARSVWMQASAPDWEAVYPSGVNRIINADFADGDTLVGWDNTGLTREHGVDFGGEYGGWHPAGGHTYWARVNGSLADNLVFQSQYQAAPVKAGNAYEFSAYVSAHRCIGRLYIYFYDDSYTALAGVCSGSAGQGNDLNGGVANNTYGADGDLSTYKRLWTHGVAPTGATRAIWVVQGLTSSSVSPYVFFTRPKFALMAPGQTKVSDWTPSISPIWIDTSDNNRPKVVAKPTSNTHVWTLSDDQRVAANAANITAVNAALTSESATRATADSTLSSSISSLTGTVSSNTSAISAEVTNRTNAVATEALSRQAVAAIAQRKIWKQATAPGPGNMFPPGSNCLVNSDLIDTTGWSYYAPSGTMTFGVDLSSAYKLESGHTLYASSSEASIDFYPYQSITSGITAGNYYEFSAYLGCHRCTGRLQIDWLGASGYISSTSSTDSGTGAEYNGGIVAANSYLGGTSLSGYRRLWVRGQAPTGATSAMLYAVGHGNGEGSPYLFMTRPFRGRIPSDQTTPSDWSPSATEQMWIDTADNNKLYLWDGASWVASDDTRIATNTAAIATMRTGASGFGVLPTDGSATNAAIATAINTLRSAILGLI